MTRKQKTVLGIIGFLILSVGLPILLGVLREYVLCMHVYMCHAWSGEWGTSFVVWIPALFAIFAIWRQYKVPTKTRNIKLLTLSILLVNLAIFGIAYMAWNHYLIISESSIRYHNQSWASTNEINLNLDDVKQINVNINYIFVAGGHSGWTCQLQATIVTNTGEIPLGDLGGNLINYSVDGSLITDLSKMGIPIVTSKAKQCQTDSFPVWITSK